MNIKQYIYLIIALFITIITQAQEFNVDEQYKQSMVNAKLALEANQYSQAVMFYREALSLKPNELLPKYKIEDIRTIYIKDVLDSLIADTPVVPSPKGKKKKKEAELEKIELEQKAEVAATVKMNEEVQEVKKELTQLKIEAEVLQITDVIVDIDDDELVSDIVPTRETGVIEVEAKEIKNLDGGISENEATFTVSQREMPVIEKAIEPKETITEIPAKKEVTKTIIKKQTAKPTNKSEDWIEEENKRLAKTYPNKKNIEEIDKPGKHITRVVMNIDNKITIYLKVKHDWGATFFFKDEIGGLELKNISETYFNLMTNLKTYEKF